MVWLQDGMQGSGNISMPLGELEHHVVTDNAVFWRGWEQAGLSLPMSKHKCHVDGLKAGRDRQN